MPDGQLSWRDRGKLWFRLGIRIILVILALWFLRKCGRPLLSLFAPFVAAAVFAALPGCYCG